MGIKNILKIAKKILTKKKGCSRRTNDFKSRRCNQET
jgi:hypothetical protein